MNSCEVLGTVSVTGSFEVSSYSQGSQFIRYREMGSRLCAPHSCVENSPDVLWLGRKTLDTNYK